MELIKSEDSVLLSYSLWPTFAPVTQVGSVDSSTALSDAEPAWLTGSELLLLPMWQARWPGWEHSIAEHAIL